MIKVYIDGSAGTTGLQIYDRLSSREDVIILEVPSEQKKDIKYKQEAINKSDITILCLPDQASIESVSLVTNPNTKIIDASTAHRTKTDWAYGFPELSEEHRKKIVNSKRVAVPGCHASGFNAIVYPLIKMGIMPANYPISAYSLTGYSGGGKPMIADYELNKPKNLCSPNQYGLTQNHKHIREMLAISGLASAPIFSPIVADYYSGMQLSVPIYMSMLQGISTIDELHLALYNYYKNTNFVQVADKLGIDMFEKGMIPSNQLSNSNQMQIYVCGNDDRVVIVAVYDNLGKGASGAAVQCMNIMCGIDETTGLI